MITITPAQFRWLAIIWMIIVFIGCAWHSDGLPDMSHGRDKWMHLAGFAPFGLLWSLAGRRPLWVLAAGLIFGLAIEVYQGTMTTDRSFDLFDALADTVGTALGLAAFWVVRRLNLFPAETPDH